MPLLRRSALRFASCLFAASLTALSAAQGLSLPLLSVTPSLPPAGMTQPAAAPTPETGAVPGAAAAAAAGGSASADPAELQRLADEAEAMRRAALEAASLPLIENNQVLAFYGHPLSKRMGILGEYSKEDLARLLKGYAKLYDEANGPLGVVPAFYLIYGTCWPEGEIGYLRDSLVREYIEYAASQGMIVFVDHQIGKYSVEEAMLRLLPYAKYPNVHFALDPEWRTTAPMKEIGSITAEELNQAQAMLDAHLLAEGIPGKKILVVHQFKGKMIEGRERVRADFPRVDLIHTADGFGSPALKRHAYAFNAKAPNMPL
ncbi:MAG: hypothetical protein JNG85_10470, partial [Spirochaetaceae bacterium]|nr:hypothetical protein [Spirochaetaceae bacterium]